jgi:hypothetical protein
MRSWEERERAENNGTRRVVIRPRRDTLSKYLAVGSTMTERNSFAGGPKTAKERAHLGRLKPHPPAHPACEIWALRRRGGGREGELGEDLIFV